MIGGEVSVDERHTSPLVPRASLRLDKTELACRIGSLARIGPLEKGIYIVNGCRAKIGCRACFQRDPRIHSRYDPITSVRIAHQLANGRARRGAGPAKEAARNKAARTEVALIVDADPIARSKPQLVINVEDGADARLVTERSPIPGTDSRIMA